MITNTRASVGLTGEPILSMDSSDVAADARAFERAMGDRITLSDLRPNSLTVAYLVRSGSVTTTVIFWGE
jgi:hypothetical protein